MNEIQERRAKIIVPGGRHLHEYACVYICGRNPMLYKRKERHGCICVIRVSPDVLDLSGVVVTNGNASSDYVRFAAAPGGLKIVDHESTFSEWWTDEDPIEYYRKKAAKCAEVLVPNCIAPRYLKGCYVSCEQGRELVRDIDNHFESILNPHMFFL